MSILTYIDLTKDIHSGSVQSGRVLYFPAFLLLHAIFLIASTKVVLSTSFYSNPSKKFFTCFYSVNVFKTHQTGGITQPSGLINQQLNFL